MIYFYLYVFDNNDSNPSFHEASRHCSTQRLLLNVFSHIDSLQMKTFTHENNNNNNSNNNTQFKFIVVNALLPARSIPSVKSHFLCGVYCFPINP